MKQSDLIVIWLSCDAKEARSTTASVRKCHLFHFEYNIIFEPIEVNQLDLVLWIKKDIIDLIIYVTAGHVLWEPPSKCLAGIIVVVNGLQRGALGMLGDFYNVDNLKVSPFAQNHAVLAVLCHYQAQNPF